MALPRVTRELVELTPKMAAELLARNPGNRNLSEKRARALAEEIKRGGWVFNGQPIIVDEDGNLLDGQHRCQAVVMAGKSVLVMIVRGVARKAFATIDSGRARSAGDALAAGGVTDAKRMAAVLRLIYQHTLGVLGSGAAAHQASNQEVSGLASEYPDVAAAVRWARSHIHTRNAPVTFLYWVTMRGNIDVARPFWEAVATGEGQRLDAPAARLRDVLFLNLRERAKRPANDILNLAIRAWVCHLAGHDVKQLMLGILDHHAMRKGDETFIPMTHDEAMPVVAQARRNKAQKATG